MNLAEINNHFGDINIYLLDQILKGRFENKNKVLDLGCGEGKNLFYFIQNKFEVYGIDQDSSSIAMCKFIANSLDYPSEKFQIGDALSLNFEDSSFDALICSNVFHFSENESDFISKWIEMSRVIKKGGFLYFEMNSNLFGNQFNSLSKKNTKYYPKFTLTKGLLDEIALLNHYDKIDPIRTIIFDTDHEQTILTLKKR